MSLVERCFRLFGLLARRNRFRGLTPQSDAGSLLTTADGELYQAKYSVGKRIVARAPERAVENVARAEMIQQMAEALAAGEFTAFFLPQAGSSASLEMKR